MSGVQWFICCCRALAGVESDRHGTLRAVSNNEGNEKIGDLPQRQGFRNWSYVLFLQAFEAQITAQHVAKLYEALCMPHTILPLWQV